MRHSQVTGAAATPEVNDLHVEPVYIHRSWINNRAARRHVKPVRFRNGVQVDYLVFVPRDQQAPVFNEPYVKEEE